MINGKQRRILMKELNLGASFQIEKSRKAFPQLGMIYWSYRSLTCFQFCKYIKYHFCRIGTMLILN